MGRHMWGKTAAGAFLAVTVAAVSGCGPGLKGPHGEKTAAPKTVSVTKAAVVTPPAASELRTPREVVAERTSWPVGTAEPAPVPDWGLSGRR
ncbi:hypothetical protein [Streptomyces sp. HYC2]|uniref:hypothetical protein n=1 Tax=Streptomyces sp. HYC2 TaxID=2955207 RepID=UPI00248119E7|nr:hypothetical protein [Streptomyces sp. HYC2]